MHSYRGIVNRLAAYTLVVCFNQLDSIGPDGFTPVSTKRHARTQPQRARSDDRSQLLNTTRLA